jgi:DNA-binding transcriptional ArsR family regulator
MPGDVYKAIGDPTRRALLDALAERERPVEELVARFGVTFSAISQHLSVLHDAGLVARRADGRRRLYRVVPGPLREVHGWAGNHLRPSRNEDPRSRILRLAAQERERYPHPGQLRSLRPTG